MGRSGFQTVSLQGENKRSTLPLVPLCDLGLMSPSLVQILSRYTVRLVLMAVTVHGGV